MDTDSIRRVFIVGAGFSCNAGLPPQSKFVEALLEAMDYKKPGPSKLMADFIARFVKDVFNRPADDPASWPYLEDIFTCLDLSANAGHYLGHDYPPSLLRTVRRVFIGRIIRMLYNKYLNARRQRDTDADMRRDWNCLQTFMHGIYPNRDAFIVMNWDGVIEMSAAELKIATTFDYGCDAVRAFPPDVRALHHWSIGQF